jgi:hypothetical protein
MAVDVGGMCIHNYQLVQCNTNHNNNSFGREHPLEKGWTKSRKGYITTGIDEGFSRPHMKNSKFDMVYLLSFGTRRCLGCDMGIIGKILWQESYVKIAWVAIGLGMAK